jgi:transposase InsO family protein
MDHYIPNATHPKRLLSDHGTQFTSPKWAEKLRECNTEILVSPIRHPQANPVERVMKELVKFFRIYCQKAQKSWPELIPHVETFLNKTVAAATGYTPVELMFNAPRPEIFSKLLPPAPETLPPPESIEDKTMRACAR